LLGAIIGGVMALAGAYLVQRQVLKREDIREMRTKIYGPMFMEMSRIEKAVKSFQSSYAASEESLKMLKDEYLFFTIGDDLKDSFYGVMNRLEKYQQVNRAALIMLNKVGHLDVMNTSGYNISVNSVFLDLLIGETTASSLDLSTAIFLRLVPQDFIKREKEKWGQNSQVMAKFSGVKTSLEDYESLYVSIQAKMEKEPLYQEEIIQRMKLIAEIELLLDKVKGFVKS
jgi:hypothetical protein